MIESLLTIARVAIVTGISIAWCKWYMDKKRNSKWEDKV